ncbi:hypothetical protein HXX76_011817 [Chlamydomonas incerta]|uniref:Uncharacterized protein n=1 Tax=Chlamydomonas incerta TaxID=51695 RepID=A0A835SJ64_CHLIN|nr:hypothetical protein HXX76_011817 [Chlamydomonas incerta]|eukprot:KAG2428137.1 hypothetical protein HXX76_011817 [Chlamydomonas incerta]
MFGGVGEFGWKSRFMNDYARKANDKDDGRSPAKGMERIVSVPIVKKSNLAGQSKGAPLNKNDDDGDIKGRLRIAPGLVLPGIDNQPVYDSPTIVVELFQRVTAAARDINWLQVAENCSVVSNFVAVEDTGACFLPRCCGTRVSHIGSQSSRRPGSRFGVHANLTDELKVDKIRALQWGVKQEVHVLHLEDIISVKALAGVRKERIATHTTNNKLALEHQAHCLSGCFPCMAPRKSNEKDEIKLKVEDNAISERYVTFVVTYKCYKVLPAIPKPKIREPKVKITRTLGVKGAKGLLGETEEEQMKRIRWYMGMKKKELEEAQRKAQAAEAAAGTLAKTLAEVKDELEEEDKPDKKVSGVVKKKTADKEDKKKEKKKSDDKDKKKDKDKDKDEDEDEDKDKDEDKDEGDEAATGDEAAEGEKKADKKQDKKPSKKSKDNDKKSQDGKSKVLSKEPVKKTAVAVKEDKDHVEWTEVAVTEWDQPEPEPEPEYYEETLEFDLLSNTDWTDEEFQVMYEDAVQLATGITRLKRWSHLTRQHPSPEVVMEHLGTPYIYNKGTGVQEPPMVDSDVVFSNQLNERLAEAMKKHRPPAPLNGDRSNRGRAGCFQVVQQQRINVREAKDDLVNQEKALIEARMLREQAELREKEAAARLAAMAAASASAAAAAAATAQVASASSTPLKFQQPSQVGSPVGSPSPSGVRIVEAGGGSYPNVIAAGGNGAAAFSSPVVAAAVRAEIMPTAQSSSPMGANVIGREPSTRQ